LPSERARETEGGNGAGRVRNEIALIARAPVGEAQHHRPAQNGLDGLDHRVGELGVCAIPCEVFTEIGLELRKKSPLKHTFTIELANGYNGYLPTPRQHELGGYETWRARSSYLEVNASPRITRLPKP